MGYYISFMKKISNAFGKRIAAVRKSRGLSQRDLAHLVGISNRMIAYYEAQTNRPPAAKLPVIANALKISIDELLAMRRCLSGSLRTADSGSACRPWKSCRHKRRSRSSNS